MEGAKRSDALRSISPPAGQLSPVDQIAGHAPHLHDQDEVEGKTRRGEWEGRVGSPCEESELAPLLPGRRWARGRKENAHLRHPLDVPDVQALVVPLLRGELDALELAVLGLGVHAQVDLAVLDLDEVIAGRRLGRSEECETAVTRVCGARRRRMVSSRFRRKSG